MGETCPDEEHTECFVGAVESKLDQDKVSIDSDALPLMLVIATPSPCNAKCSRNFKTF